ncbi:YebC-like protein [Amylocystis lapponica]|nr:YebC-like protein [Amylocystis lapponica]
MNLLLRLPRSAPLPPLRRPFTTSRSVLSGHNKWSKIKQKKGALDLQKGVIYSRANRDIVLAVRTGGNADPELNPALAAVLRRAKSQGVPRENIESALKKATGGKEQGDQLLTYEAMAPGSIAVIIECLSNNVNRTMHTMRNVLNLHSARFADVAFLFQRKGCVRVLLAAGADLDERVERLVEAAIDAEADDYDQADPADDAVEMTFMCPPTGLARLTDAIAASGLCRELVGSELVYVPNEPCEAPDEETERAVGNLVEQLEENDDVLRVWTALDS